MALSTYQELKAAIATQLNRTDLTTPIVDFVALAEADIRRDVRMQEMETLATGTLGAGGTLAFPTRFVMAIRFAIDGTVYRYVTPELYQAAVDAENTTSPIYTIIGTSFYVLGGASGDAYSLIYMASFAAFSANGDNNALLTNAPDVYLYGACKHAALYLKDNDDAAKYAGAYNVAVDRVNRQNEQKKYRGSTLEVWAV